MKARTAKQKKFEEQLDAFVDRVEAEVWFAKIIAARFVAKKLVEFSPVWSGPFVKSHRLGIDWKDPTYQIFKTVDDTAVMLAMKVSSTKAKAIKNAVLAKLQNEAFEIGIKDNKVILSNCIPYGPAVEYLYGPRNGYHVYGKTRAALRANRKAIMAKARANVEKVKSGKYTARQAD